MPNPADYLEVPELREIIQIDADRDKLRAELRQLSLRKQRIRARGVHRMECARLATEARR